MTTYDAERYKNYRPAASPHSAGEEMVQTAHYAYPSGGLSANDLVRLMRLPEGTVVTDFKADFDDHDACSTPLMSVQVGLLNSAGTDLDASNMLLSTSTTPRTGGIANRSHIAGSKLYAPQTDSDGNYEEKTVAMKIVAAPATGTTGADSYFCLKYKAAEHGY